MLFSVIVPVYNVENYLEECLNSIISQIKQCKYETEIIIIDDGSTDKSGTICDAYKEIYKGFIQVIHNQNQGLILTRRCGLKNAHGEYVINCDSDDKLSSGALDKIADVINESAPDVIFFNMDTYDGMTLKPYYSNVFTDERKCDLSHEDVMKTYFLSNIPVVTSMASKVVKRACFDKDMDYSMFSKISMGEDTLQSAEIYKRAKSFVYLNENLYAYRMGSGMTAEFDCYYFEKFKKVLQHIGNYKYIKNNSTYEKWINAKLLNTVGRAITQSGYCKSMSFKERKLYIKKIMKDSAVTSLLPELKSYKKLIERRYYMVIKMSLNGMMAVICFILKAKNLNNLSL